MEKKIIFEDNIKTILNRIINEEVSKVKRDEFARVQFKIDELPQLLNVLIGDMSLVGPRPEVKKFVELYSSEQLKVLQVRPGITDEASIIFKNENEILAKSVDPERTYIDEIMPAKLELNLAFIRSKTLHNYFSIILRTLIS